MSIWVSPIISIICIGIFRKDSHHSQREVTDFITSLNIFINERNIVLGPLNTKVKVKEKPIKFRNIMILLELPDDL